MSNDKKDFFDYDDFAKKNKSKKKKKDGKKPLLKDQPVKNEQKPPKLVPAD